MKAGEWMDFGNFQKISSVMIFVMVKATVAGVPGRKINLCSSAAKLFLNGSIDVPL